MHNGLDEDLPTKMLAARIERFGGIEVIDIARSPMPRPGAGEVLLKVAAAGIGPWDALVRTGKSGLPQPLPLTLGSDLSGIVADPGDSDFTVGDAVFGVTNARFTGAQAEYALAEAGRLTRKPATLSFVEAAAVPVVAVTASSMLFELGQLELGQRVLIHGGAGSVGSLAVQFAKRAGAHVIATCFAKDVALVQSLGADEVIDVGTTPFAKTVKYADLVIDTVGGVTQTASFDILVPGGRLISSVSQPDEALAGEHHVQGKWFIVDVTRAKLDDIAGLFATGRIKILVGEVLTLAEVPLAHEMLAGKPHRPGKIVIQMDSE